MLYLSIKVYDLNDAFPLVLQFQHPQHFIVSYLRHSLCSVYVHLCLFLTKNKLKCTLEQYSISLEYHETA